MLQDANTNKGKPSARRDVILVFVVCILRVIVTLVITFVIGGLLAPKHPNTTEIPDPNGWANIAIVYPASTNICVGGCQIHQNWIEFHLPSGGYLRNSVRLKTSLFAGQILTVGIAPSPCGIKDEYNFMCLHMLVRATLLRVLTEFNIIPLSQLRDTGNWWLEYKRYP